MSLSYLYPVFSHKSLALISLFTGSLYPSCGEHLKLFHLPLFKLQFSFLKLN